MKKYTMNIYILYPGQGQGRELMEHGAAADDGCGARGIENIVGKET